MPTEPYMYDERQYGEVPSQAGAQKLLADIKSGAAYLHHVSEPGCIERLGNIAAGQTVDASFWQQ